MSKSNKVKQIVQAIQHALNTGKKADLKKRDLLLDKDHKYAKAATREVEELHENLVASTAAGAEVALEMCGLVFDGAVGVKADPLLRWVSKVTVRVENLKFLFKIKGSSVTAYVVAADDVLHKTKTDITKDLYGIDSDLHVVDGSAHTNAPSVAAMSIMFLKVLYATADIFATAIANADAIVDSDFKCSCPECTANAESYLELLDVKTPEYYAELPARVMVSALFDLYQHQPDTEYVLLRLTDLLIKIEQASDFQTFVPMMHYLVEADEDTVFIHDGTLEGTALSIAHHITALDLHTEAKAKANKPNVKLKGDLKIELGSKITLDQLLLLLAGNAIDLRTEVSDRSIREIAVHLGIVPVAQASSLNIEDTIYLIESKYKNQIKEVKKAQQKTVQ